MPDPPSKPLHAKNVKKRKACHGIGHGLLQAAEEEEEEEAEATTPCSKRVHNVSRQQAEAKMKAPDVMNITTVSLQECMVNIMEELRDARENLFQWMKREIRGALSASASELGKKEFHRPHDAEDKGGKSDIDLREGHNNSKHGNGRLDCDPNHGQEANTCYRRDTTHEVSTETKNGGADSDVLARDGSATRENMGDADAVDTSANEDAQKASNFDSNSDANVGCVSVESDVEGLLFKPRQAIHEVCPDQEHYFDIGFGDRGSNPGHESVSSLGSAKEHFEPDKSSEVILGTAKEHSGLNKSSDVTVNRSCSAFNGHDKKVKEEPGVADGVGSSDSGGFNNKVANEFPEVVNVVLREGKPSNFDMGLIVNAKDTISKVECKAFGNVAEFDMREASYRVNNVQGHEDAIGAHQFSEPTNECGDAPNKLTMCNIGRSYGSATMTFKGSALEDGNETTKASIEHLHSHSNDGFPTKPSHNGAELIGNIGLASGAEKCKFGFCDQNDLENSASMWNILRSSCNVIDPSHLNQMGHSKFGGDNTSSSGRKVTFTGFDSRFSYASQVQADNAMLDAYQGRMTTSSMYFSTPDFVHLNGPMGMQFLPPSSMHSHPMLMGTQGPLAIDHGPSNRHTFLGLGMNAQSVAMNQMEALSAVYIQGSLNGNGTSKQLISISNSLVAPHQSNNPSEQERGGLELNF